jgi:Activator of Hsp90 ATPase homolog 1-like protein
VEFHEDGDRTTVVLTHTGLPTEETRDAHEDGWIKCLDNLEIRVFST